MTARSAHVGRSIIIRRGISDTYHPRGLEWSGLAIGHLIEVRDEDGPGDGLLPHADVQLVARRDGHADHRLGVGVVAGRSTRTGQACTSPTAKRVSSAAPRSRQGYLYLYASHINKIFLLQVQILASHPPWRPRTALGVFECMNSDMDRSSSSWSTPSWSKFRDQRSWAAGAI